MNENIGGRKFKICVGWRRGSGQSASSRTAPTRITDRLSQTTCAAARGERRAGTLRTCLKNHCRGTSASCATAPWPDRGSLLNRRAPDPRQTANCDVRALRYASRTARDRETAFPAPWR
jgi:hypothetical protein